MIRKASLLFLYFVCIVSYQSCTCDCFDEPDYAYTFEVDFKSYKTGIPINEFLNSKDSLGKPSYYQIKVYNDDINFWEDYFLWHGNGKGDSIVIFTLWSSPKKVSLDIDVVGLNHAFTKFELDGYNKGSFNCECFTPTKKTVTMDDSIQIDVLNSNIVFKKN